MLLNNRVIFKNNTALTDLSVKLNNIHSGTETVDIIALQDALYIGSDLPFNHRYIDVSTANDQASVISVSLWDGAEWVPAVDVIDQTVGSAGKTLSQSGIISWTPDKDESWMCEDSTEEISDLSTLKIYNMYWAKLSFSSDLKATTALKYVGHKFSNEEDLGGFYPELLKSSVKTAFQSSKTAWTEQLVEAAETIVRDLRKKGIVWSENQVLDWQKFSEASSHKTAEIIWNAFGKNEEDRAEGARKAYKEAFSQQVFNVDKDKDGRLDKSEKMIARGIVRR